MAILKCKMCGGDLVVQEGVSTAECEYCGSLQTIPKVDDEKKLTLFSRANRLRAACEFDKAAGIYESIVADFPEEAEAYWGLVLCKYGIEYVDDPATGNKIPTCHRSSFESIMEDSDYEQALENADTVARRVYRGEAKIIEELRKGIIAVSANEEPYDIFICYKETAEDGNRTLDSVIAQDVYDALTDKGYRTFFSRISLEDKLGVEYEPYIFAALNSAKLMLVFGTDFEHFDAVWVKNEWSRFLKLMAKDKDRHLIPCYKGIDAYDMPKEFAKLQAQDMGKLGAIQDLLRGIDKIIGSKQKVKTQIPKENLTQILLKDNVMYEGESFAGIPHGHGKAIYADGDVYEGQWNRGKRQGKGKLIYAEGGQWEGEFHDELPFTGIGVCCSGMLNRLKKSFSSVEPVVRYEGELVDGVFHGQGVITYKNGTQWEGTFEDGKPFKGKGFLYWADEEKTGVPIIYEGELNRGRREGYGRYKRGSYTYEGNYLCDDRSGFGKEIRDGSTYEGNWENDCRSGFGKEICQDATYEGNWLNGVRSGQGKLIWKDGSQWVGEFKNGAAWNGKGVRYIKSEDGSHLRYDGETKNGKRHGFGKFFYSDAVYEGQWADGVRSGQGKLIWNEGGEWTGEFREDKRWTGSGVWRYSDGQYIGPWKNGVRQGMAKFVWNKGGQWTGEFRDDKRWTGHGVWHFNDSYYDGPWVEGKSCGQGKLVWYEGGEWTGEFRDDKRWTGSGVWRYSDGQYIGPWKNGVRQGMAKFVWNKGGEWVGEYRDDKRWNGSGVCYYSDCRYDGEMKKGKRHGKGTIYWNAGGEWTGSFNKGAPWNGSGTFYYTDGKRSGTWLLGRPMV